MHVRWIIGGCKMTSSDTTKRCLQVYQVEIRNIWALSSSDEPEPSPLLAAGTGLAAAVHRKHENNGFLFVWFRFFGIGCNKNHKWTILYTIKGLHRWYIHEDIAKYGALNDSPLESFATRKKHASGCPIFHGCMGSTTPLHVFDSLKWPPCLVW